MGSTGMGKRSNASWFGMTVSPTIRILAGELGLSYIIVLPIDA